MSNPHSQFQGNDLTAARLEALLSRLDTDRERAGERYEEIRWKLIKFFQWGSCFEAEDLSDETFNRVAEKLVSEEEDIQNVVAFTWGVARRIRQEAQRKNTRTVRLSDVPGAEDLVRSRLPVTGVEQDLPKQHHRLKCLRNCIRQLSTEERNLFLTYHSPKGRRVEQRRGLAQKIGITMLALRVRANRLRFKLEECIKECLSSGTI